MFGMKITIEGDFDIDHLSSEFECPTCSFFNSATMKQIRLNDVMICRGCKTNIQLIDQMNSMRKARQYVRRSMKRLQNRIDHFNNSFS